MLAWNAVVYVLLIAWPLVRMLRRAPRRPGPLVRAMEALLRSRRWLPRASAGGSATAVRAFASLWLERSAPLAALRAETVLHAAAASLALGLVAGIYARGLVLDYRVVWESTFLDAAAAHAIVATVLGPARVSIHPYGIAPTPQATLGLRALLVAALGPRLELEFAATVGFGREDETTASVDPACTHAVALFEMGATPELDNQGRFVRALVAALPGGATAAAVVDATAFVRRFAAVGARVAERRDAWREWGDAVGVVALIVELEAFDAAAAAAGLETAFALPAAAAAP